MAPTTELAPNQEFLDCLRELVELRKFLSPSEIARKLNDSEEFRTVDRTTIHRWLKCLPDDAAPMRAQTEARIIRAVQFLRTTKDVEEISIGVIDQACEMLPVLLLGKRPNLQKECRVSIKLKPFKTNRECLTALYDGVLDVAIAPTHLEKEFPSPKVWRFFEFADVKIASLLPFHLTSDRTIAAFLNTLATNGEGKALGLLPNSDAFDSLKEFMLANGFRTPPTKVPVHNSSEALTKFEEGLIVGMLGHPIFIANCQELMVQKGIRGLTYASGVFCPVRMSVFINADSERAALAARKTLKLMRVCIDDLPKVDDLEKEVAPAIVKDINEVLGFTKENKFSGLDVLREFSFSIKNFDVRLLVLLLRS